jgi:hypothetical protein
MLYFRIRINQKLVQKTAVKQGREFDKPNFLVVYPLARLPLDPEKTHYPAVVIDKSNGCYPLILDTTKRIKSFLSSIVNIKNLVSSQDIMGASEWTKELQVKILKKIPYFWWKDTKGVKGGKILYLKPQLEEVFGKPLDDGVSRVSDEAIAAKLYPR